MGAIQIVARKERAPVDSPGLCFARPPFLPKSAKRVKRFGHSIVTCPYAIATIFVNQTTQ